MRRGRNNEELLGWDEFFRRYVLRFEMKVCAFNLTCLYQDHTLRWKIRTDYSLWWDGKKSRLV